jgi:hypothetical protein
MSEVPRFLNICAAQRGFNIRKKHARLSQAAFPGMVVASREALYFVPGVGSMPPSPIGGLFGKLLRAPQLGDLGGEMDLAEVPAEITEHPDWPVTWDEGPVFVLPREAVEELRTSFWLGGIEMNLPDVRILVFTPVFRRKQMAAYLDALGWEIAGIEKDSSLVPKADTDPNRPTARTVQKKKQAVTIMVVGLFFVLASLGTLLWQLRWVKSAFAGPVPVTPAELRQLSDPDTMSNPWVSFAYDQSEDTGLGIVSTGLLQTILGTGRSRYILIAIQDRWLIAEVHEGHAGNRVTGSLARWSTPLRQEMLADVHARFPAHRMLPFQLDAHYAYRSECFALLCLVGFFFLAGVFLIVRGRMLSFQGELNLQ